MDRLPEAYRTADNFTKYIDPTTNDLDLGKLAQSHHNLMSMAKVPEDQMLRLPKADAKAEEWGAVFDRLGRPAAAADYAFNGIEMKHEGDKVFVEGFRETAHAIGLSQKQMDGIMGYLGKAFADSDAAEMADYTARKTAGEAELKTAWGDKYDIYANEVPGQIEKLADAAGIIDLKADPEAGKTLLEQLHERGLTNDPVFMRIMGKVADMVAEPGALTGNGKVVAGAMSVAQAEAAKMALLSDEKKLSALHDRNDPLHASVLQERDRLNAIITGQQAA